MYGKSRRIDWIMIGFDWIRLDSMMVFEFPRFSLQLQTSWNHPNSLESVQEIRCLRRIQEDPVASGAHCCWKARDGPVAFRCLVSTCFNLFAQAEWHQELPIWCTESSDFCSAVESPFQGPYPFCCTVFNPAAHGIGDDEGLPLTTSTTSHLSLVSSGLWTKLFNGCSDEYQMQPIYIVCRYTCWGETWWNMVKQGPQAIRFASSKSFLDAASMSWEDLGDMSFMSLMSLMSLMSIAVTTEGPWPLGSAQWLETALIPEKKYCDMLINQLMKPSAITDSI